MRLSPLVVLWAVPFAFSGCHTPDPNSVEDQVAILKASNKTIKEKAKACENLRKIGKKEAVPGLAEALKTVPVKLKGDVAQALGELKDPSAIPALADALDLSVGSGTDKMTSEANDANKDIARALGDIGSPAAVQPLIQLLQKTRDNYVRIEAMAALGKLKDPAAVDVLSEVATDERLEPLINKKAIMALTQINDAKALPVYLKMAFAERRGISFYPESSLGVFMLGNAAKDRVLSLVKGEDKEIMDWAKGRQIIKPAIFAKSAQMESNLQDKRAIEPLMRLLKLTDDDPEVQMAVRAQAADALGHMRAKEAAPALAAMLTEEDDRARGAYVRALVQIGDRSVLPKMVQCGKEGGWSARERCAQGLALLGTASEVKVLDGYIKDEPKLFKKECNEGLYGEGIDCAAQEDSNVASRTKLLSGYKKALETLAACADDKCLEQALGNTDPVVREGAAYELGRRTATGSLQALFTAIKKKVDTEDDLNPRFAAICAVGWIASGDPAGLKEARTEANALEALVLAEKDKTLTMRIAEEIKRLAFKLQRPSL